MYQAAAGQLGFGKYVREPGNVVRVKRAERLRGGYSLINLQLLLTARCYLNANIAIQACISKSISMRKGGVLLTASETNWKDPVYSKQKKLQVTKYFSFPVLSFPGHRAVVPPVKNTTFTAANL